MTRLLAIAALLAMVVAMVGLWLIHSLFTPSPIAIAVQCAALALMVWARATLGRRSFHAGAQPTSGGLVSTGPYRFIRHPIYTAACLIGWSGVLANWSIAAAGFGTLLVAGAVVRLLCEERLVTELYPEYRAYAQATKRMIPYVF